MIQAPLLIQLLIVIIPLYALGMLLPEYTRSTLFFGVTLPPEAHRHPQLAEVKKNYRRRFTQLFLLSWLMMMAVSRATGSFDLLYGGGVMVTIFVLSVSYVITHNRVKALKEQHQWTKNLKQRVVVDTSRESRTHYVSHAWFILPGFITLATWLITWRLYPHLPDQVPQLTGLGGEVLQWTDKSFKDVFGLPITQLGMLALFFIVTVVIRKARKLIDPSRPTVSVKQHQAANRRWSVYILFAAVWMVAYFSLLQATLLQLLHLPAAGFYALHALSVAAPLLGIFVVAWSTGQSAARVKVSEGKGEDDDTAMLPVDDDQYWKWGMFYYNPDDPAIWIEKRFGIGWTLNFANPLALGFMVVLLLVIAAGVMFDL